MENDWQSWGTLAKRVRGRRKMLGMTQQKLADDSGMNQGDISKIERGEILRTTKVPQLARALRCDPFWLDAGEGRPDAGGQDQPPLTLDYNIPPENVFEALTEAEKAMLTNYRTMSDDDRREIDTEIELRAAKSRALMRQFLERFGVVNADDISDEEAVAAFRKMFEASQRLFEAPKDQSHEK